MASATFLYDNLADGGTITYSSQHANFPASNLQKEWFTKSWRSNYEAGSGWGNFNIEAGVNDDIDFEETAASELTATLTAGTYTADELATEIKTQLEATGASTYTITYSDSTNKFTLASDRSGGGGTFKLLWNTGTNTATTVGGTIGFDTNADDADAASHTADNLRIHSEEWVVIDLGSATDIDSFALKYHNLTTSATIKLQGNASDAWGSPSYDQTLTKTADIISHFTASTETYRYWRIYITDVENSDGYIELGRISIGECFTTDSNYWREYTKELVDPSDVFISDGGQLTSNNKTKYEVHNYDFLNQSSSEATTFKAMWTELGMTGGMFFFRDKDIAASALYARFSSTIQIDHRGEETYYSVFFTLEELR